MPAFDSDNKTIGELAVIAEKVRLHRLSQEPEYIEALAKLDEKDKRIAELCDVGARLERAYIKKCKEVEALDTRIEELEGHYPEELMSAITHEAFCECVCGKNDPSCPDWWRYEGPRLQASIAAVAERLEKRGTVFEPYMAPREALEILKPTGKDGK